MSMSYVGLAALQAKARAAMVQAVTESGEHLVGEAQPLTRVRTGAERAGIHLADVQAGATSVTARVQTGGESSAYDIFQHEGTIYMSGTHFLALPLLANRPTYIEAMNRAAAGEF